MTVMATTQVQAAAPAAARSTSLPLLCLIAGWLLPGAGHFLLRKPVRGLLLALAILTMFTVGIGLKGKIYGGNLGDLLDMLGFVAQLGTGLLYFFARIFDWGQPSVTMALGDYGTKFIIVAGLLNVVSAIDAHSLAMGRKAS